MKTVFCLCIYSSILYSQFSFSGNVETRIGESRNGFYNNESLINTQIHFGYFSNWIQFEFSDPPELGQKYNGLRKLRLEYKNGPIELKLGDMYEIWGRGLILNSLDDQSIDRDSGIRGIGIGYNIESFNIQFLTGRSDLSLSTIYAPGFDSRVPNYTTSHNIYGANTEWLIRDHLVGITFLQSKESHPVNTFPADTLDLKNRLLSAHYSLNNSIMDIYIEYVKNWSTILVQETSSYDNNLDGRGFYGNLNLYFSLFSINMEYINYQFGTLNPTNRWNNVDNYGMVQEFQNPPIANLIHETTLLNRTSHQIDFNNEVGYKLEILGSITDSYEFLGFISRSSRSHAWSVNNDYTWKKEGKPALFPHSNPAATPFNTIYGEITAYFLDYALHTKVGYSISEDIIDLTFYSKTDAGKTMNYTYQYAKTFPINSGYTFANGWSIDAKIETQWIRKGIWRYEENNGTVVADSLISEFSNENGEIVKSQTNTFISISIGKTPKWTVAFTLDKTSISEASFGSVSADETSSSSSLEEYFGLDKSKNWVNIEFVYNVTSSLRLSIMVGSLKGGLLCSNGVCRIIEPFDNGVKMGITAAF